MEAGHKLTTQCIYFVNAHTEIIWTYLEVVLEISWIITEAWKQGPDLRLQQLITVDSNFIGPTFQSNTSLSAKQINHIFTHARKLTYQTIPQNSFKNHCKM
jgi:hypothetical protein